ncbi:hypothetical protein M011DRAFT_462764 [Sporormia fimetaria CBS 119925]|uniref:Lytic polysaccharide monooxygenase n=1 Tax=Sporormia fimetaria CBS 119925 TaxID=1340428 RepID=A0A6A6UYJ9_9PLEO|nr:hypothetical protein M011DRAFT_462764 [Sporormia fimetaria CBS 119925]
MRSLAIPLITLGFCMLTHALPAANTTCNPETQTLTSDTIPVFDPHGPKSINTTWLEENRIGGRGPFDPPNCAIDMVHETNVVGDGSPTKWTYWKQISLPLDCNNGGCSSSKQDQTSYSIGFSASGPINRWITAGFNVEMSYATGEGYECNGEEGQTVCVWVMKHHYEYTVQDIDYPMDPRCGRKREGPEVRVTSPLGGDRGLRVGCYRSKADCPQKGAAGWSKGWHNE